MIVLEVLSDVKSELGTHLFITEVLGKDSTQLPLFTNTDSVELFIVEFAIPYWQIAFGYKSFIEPEVLGQDFIHLLYELLKDRLKYTK